MATIIGMMTNDHPRDGGHPLDRLEDFYHFREVDLPRDGDHPKIGDLTITRMVTIVEMVVVLGIFTIQRDGYLILGL